MHRYAVLVFAITLTSVLGIAQEPPPTFADVVSLNFPRWDANRDGVLYQAELDAAILDRRYGTEAAVAVAVLKQITADPNYGNVKLTPADVQALPKRPRVKGVPGVEALYAYGLYRVANRDAALFETGRPRLDTVRQGLAGNCFCLAPLGGMVARDALAVGRMFQPWPGGGHRVTFGDGRAVTIPPLTDAEVVLVGTNDGGGRWVSVYEKAVAEVLNTDTSGKPGTALALDATARGGPTGKVMALLTGHKVRIAWLNPPPGLKVAAVPPAELNKLLADNVGTRLVCAATPDATTTPDLTPQHAYAVVGFERQSGVVKVWNPHGNTFRPRGPAGPKNGYPTEDGLSAVPADEFGKLFADVLIETTEPAGKK